MPLLNQVQSLSTQPFYQKGVNAGKDDEQEEEEISGPTSESFDDVTSEMKRNAFYRLDMPQFFELIRKIEKLPFQEKHVMQQVSILGNLEELGVLESSAGEERCEDGELAKNSNGVPAVVEIGAGRE